MLAGDHWTRARARRAARSTRPGPATSTTLAKSLFTDFIWAFEITAVLLVIAVVGGVVLARRSGHRPERRSRADGDRATAAEPRTAQRPCDRPYPIDITPTYYLMLASMLFTIGAVGLLVRTNTLVMFMCIELMLNAANLTFVSYAKALNDISGQVIVFFTLVVAAAEVAVGLAIIVAIFRRRQDVTADDVDLLKG